MGKQEGYALLVCMLDKDASPDNGYMHKMSETKKVSVSIFS